MQSTRRFNKRPMPPTSPQPTPVNPEAISSSRNLSKGIVIQTATPLHTKPVHAESQAVDHHHDHDHHDHHDHHEHSHGGVPCNGHDHAHDKEPQNIYNPGPVDTSMQYGQYNPAQNGVYTPPIPSQSVHSLHDHHDHDHHDHDHHDHDHHGHDHGVPHIPQIQTNYYVPAHTPNDHHDHHGHDHHGHDHHGHDHHGHDHHGHDHGHDHHVFPTVFTPPLPSWSEIFSSLSPAQKTLFTWFVIYIVLGMWLWSAGTSQESLAAVGFSYLLMFDALGVLNSFASSIIHTHPAYSVSTTKRPFGARRQEIVFALGTIIFLLFVTMYNTKEALEHFLLEGSHDGGHGSQTASHHRMSFGLFTLVCLGLMASFVSSVGLRNHDHFVRFLRRAPPTVHGFSYNVINRGRDNPIHALVNNVYSLSIVASGITILLFSVLGLVTPSMDKVLALGESGVMLYLGYPTAVALAKVLLQMTPDGVRQGVDNRLAEIRLDPRVIAIDRVHFWQNTYGKYVGTLEVQIRPEADESSVLWMVYEKLEGFTSEGNQKSELTVSIIKL